MPDENIIGGGSGTTELWEKNFDKFKQRASMTITNVPNGTKKWGTVDNPEIVYVYGDEIDLKNLVDSHGVLLIEGDTVVLDGNLDYHGLVLIKANTITMTGNVDIFGEVVVIGATEVNVVGGTNIKYDSKALIYAGRKLVTTGTTTGGVRVLSWSELDSVIAEP